MESSSHDQVTQLLQRCATNFDRTNTITLWTGNTWLFEYISDEQGYKLPRNSDGRVYKSTLFCDISDLISSTHNISTFIDVGCGSAILSILTQFRGINSYGFDPGISSGIPGGDNNGIRDVPFAKSNAWVLEKEGFNPNEHLFACGIKEFTQQLKESPDFFVDCISFTGVLHTEPVTSGQQALEDFLKIIPYHCRYFIGCGRDRKLDNVLTPQRRFGDHEHPGHWIIEFNHP